jgi:hypothetical protein
MQHPSCPKLRHYPGYGQYSVHFCYICGQLLHPTDCRYEATFNFTTGKCKRTNIIHFPSGSNYHCHGQPKLLVATENMAERIRSAANSVSPLGLASENIRDVLVVSLFVVLCAALWPIREVSLVELTRSLFYAARAIWSLLFDNIS